ncbi:MAG: SDR family oxidoreductase [Paracoccaceae bacterium]
MPEMKRLSSKVILITGAASDLGAAFARRCSAEGASVICTDIDDGAAKALAGTLGDGSIGLHCDVTDAASVRRAVKATQDRYGKLDGVVHNAAIATEDGTVVSLSEKQWRQEIDVTLTGAFLVCKHAIPLMEPQGSGSIVFIASTYGHVAAPQSAAYCAAKAGLIHLAKAIAADYALAGIRANSVSPGAVKTNRLLKRWPDLDAAETALASAHLLNRIAEPDEIAGAVAYLLSPDSAFVTGTDLLVDGGFTAI